MREFKAKRNIFGDYMRELENLIEKRLRKTLPRSDFTAGRAELHGEGIEEHQTAAGRDHHYIATC